MDKTGVIILAAGSASRFGNIKQLQPFQGTTLLQHVVDAALDAVAAPVVVVTGAYATDISATLDHSRVTVVFNEQWELGMASGIVSGVQKTLALTPDIQQIIIAVCDQPFVSAGLFTRLCQTQLDTGKPIVASAYADTMGTPVLFTKSFFEHLLALQGQEGARKLLKTHSPEVAMVDFPQGHIDIDTQADYERLQGIQL